MTFGELFSEISYAYEPQYEPDIWEEKGVRYCTFYKLTIGSDGVLEYKGQHTTFDPALYWKAELMAKLLRDDPTVKVLYG